MLDESELLVLMADLESERIERTVSETNTDKFGEAICAFANDIGDSKQPGYLLIGVTDSGAVSGLKATDRLLQNLGGIRSDGNVAPQPSLNIQSFSLSAGDVVVVRVLPSDLPPVRYKSRCWIRVGPRRATANEQEERILFEKRQSKAKSFDAQSCPEAKLEELARPLFEEYRLQAVDPDTISANKRSYREQLASLRFFDTSVDRPTHAGLILFGKNTRYFLAGAYVQFLHFPKKEIVDTPIDHQELGGDLASLIRLLEEKLRAVITSTVTVTEGFKEENHETYPYWALRELVLNSLMHRDWHSSKPNGVYVFSDRIEIVNPGNLYGEATIENFPQVNAYRNPIIAEALKVLGYVNRFGYGVQRAQDLLRQSGNREAEFHHQQHSTKVVIFARGS